jgi:putative membrane protein
MPGALIRWLITAFALWLTTQVVSGVQVDGLIALGIGAFVLGLFNAFLRPVLLLLTLPINLVTLGLFTFVVNGIVLKLTSAVVPGFVVQGFFAAVFGSLLISIFSFMINLFINDRGQVEYVYVKRSL